MKLYHATYKARMPSIKEFGLGAKQFKNWIGISADGVVYFSLDPYVAESYCEVAEDVEDEVYDSGIVILCVDSLELDECSLWEESEYEVVYTGVISPELLYVWDEDKLTPLLSLEM
jgi:hypothetical protein